MRFCTYICLALLPFAAATAMATTKSSNSHNYIKVHNNKSSKQTVFKQKPQPVKMANKQQIAIPQARTLETFSEDPELANAVAFALNGAWKDANSAASKAKNPKFASEAIEAVKVYNSPTSYSLLEIMQFFRNHSWVPREAYASKIEKSISYDRPANDVIAWFSQVPPKSNHGKFMLLFANLQNGSISLQNKDTLDLFRYYWRTTEFDGSSEEYFIKKYRNDLRIEDCLRKIEFLTWNKSYGLAGKLIEILPNDYTSVAKMRLEIAKNPSVFNRITSSASDKAKGDDFIQYSYIDMLLKDDRDHDAEKRLLAITPSGNYEKWWKVKNAAIRNALRDKRYTSAYNLTQNHKLEPGAEYSEAEWLAGWISLRFLGRADVAKVHFQNIFDNSKLGNTKSKAAYWLARSYDALDEKNDANLWYDQAATFSGTFYGQLAIAKLYNEKNYNYFSKIHLSNDEYERFKNNQNVKKLTQFSYLVGRSGYTGLSNLLLNHIADFDADHHILRSAAYYFSDKKLYSMAVEIGKAAANRSSVVIQEGYPNHIPVYNNNLPKGLYYAIIRQESNFNPNAVSVAGARGLMQLMPDTAARIAAKLGLHKNSYITDPTANVRKGVKFIDDMYDNYGSYVLTIAAYNAGPGNVKKWVERNGDPRKFSTIDEVIDWIELIPFNETRNYVKKVLENFTVYNAIVSGEQQANKIEEYLRN
jgi:soluble lytic murein transglycosylase